jgi:hypothetical protein
MSSNRKVLRHPQYKQPRRREQLVTSTPATALPAPGRSATKTRPTAAAPHATDQPPSAPPPRRAHRPHRTSQQHPTAGGYGQPLVWRSVLLLVLRSRLSAPSMLFAGFASAACRRAAFAFQATLDPVRAARHIPTGHRAGTRTPDHKPCLTDPAPHRASQPCDRLLPERQVGQLSGSSSSASPLRTCSWTRSAKTCKCRSITFVACLPAKSGETVMCA